MTEPRTWDQAADWARSPDWSRRLSAGRWLSKQDRLDAGRPLVWELLLDAENVAVTQVVAETLLARQDLDGLSLVLEATISGDDQQQDYLHAAFAEAILDEAVGVAAPGLVARLRILAATGPPSIAGSASRVLAEISPH